MKENKEKNMESMFHSTIGKMIVLAIDTFTKAKSNAYAFCAYVERFENVATPEPPSKRTCEKEKIALKQPIVSRRLRIVSLFLTERLEHGPQSVARGARKGSNPE